MNVLTLLGALPKKEGFTVRRVFFHNALLQRAGKFKYIKMDLLRKC